MTLITTQEAPRFCLPSTRKHPFLRVDDGITCPKPNVDKIDLPAHCAGAVQGPRLRLVSVSTPAVQLVNSPTARRYSQ